MNKIGEIIIKLIYIDISIPITFFNVEKTENIKKIDIDTLISCLLVKPIYFSFIFTISFGTLTYAIIHHSLFIIYMLSSMLSTSVDNTKTSFSFNCNLLFSISFKYFSTLNRFLEL